MRKTRKIGDSESENLETKLVRNMKAKKNMKTKDKRYSHRPGNTYERYGFKVENYDEYFAATDKTKESGDPTQDL